MDEGNRIDGTSLLAGFCGMGIGYPIREAAWKRKHTPRGLRY